MCVHSHCKSLSPTHGMSCRRLLTCLDLAFRGEAKLGAEKVESASSSLFSRCVALEHSLCICPLTHCTRLLKTERLFSLSNKRQHVLEGAAIV